MSFWKFTSKEALAAWDEMELQEAELKKQGDEFSALFGGKPVYQKTACDWRFYGVRFDGREYNNPALWTKATSKNGYAQQPRVKVPAILKRESEALWQLWNEHRPSMKVNRDSFFEAIGFDWGTLLFSGFGMFRHGDVIYAETGATPKAEAGGVEILGSEYGAARKAAEDRNVSGSHT